MIPAFITDNPMFGFALTITVLLGFTLLFGKSKSLFLNPFLFSLASIILILLGLQIPYAHYDKGGSILSFFLGPAIVSLAVPLYRQFDKIKANALPVLAGISAGTIVSILSGVGVSLLLGLNREMAVSMAPKGATSGISMNLAALMGGDPALTIVFVNTAGISGYILGVKLLDAFRVKSPAARGLALGTASHAMGAKRGLELGEEEGAMASLSIGLAGVLTSFFMPLIIRLLGI